jgi:hypothetical protein
LRVTRKVVEKGLRRIARWAAIEELSDGNLKMGQYHESMAAADKKQELC